MARPIYADEAVVILTFLDPPQSTVFPKRIIRLDRARDKVSIGRTSNRNQQYRAMLDNAWIDSAVMSREHAQLQLDIPERKVFLVDVGSLHGTYANGTRVSGNRKHQIRNGDFLEFGITVQHGPEAWLPCKAKADVIFGRLDPAQRPAIFVVPDESDVEEQFSSNSQDASVVQSCKTLWTNSITPASQTPAKQRVAIIDLTSNDKITRAQQTDHGLFHTNETPMRPDWENADEDFPESRIPTPPETDDRHGEENIWSAPGNGDEDEDVDSEQVADDGDAFDGDDDDDDDDEFDDDDDIFDYESRVEEDELDAIDHETRSREPSEAISSDGEQDPNVSPSFPVPPVLENAVYGLSLTEDKHDDVPMSEEEYEPIRPAPLLSPGTDSGISPWASISIRQKSPSRTGPLSARPRYSIGIRVAGSRMSPERVERARSTGQRLEMEGDLIGLHRDDSNSSPLDEMEIEFSGPAGGSESRPDSSAYQWELSKRMEAKKAAWSRVSDNLVKTRLQSPPVAGAESVSRPPKRKITEMSRDDEQEESKERFVSPQPLANASAVAVGKDVTAPAAADNANERAPKRLRKVVEVLGYATLGGVAVMSALIATAPSL